MEFIISGKWVLKVNEEFVKERKGVLNFFQPDNSHWSKMIGLGTACSIKLYNFIKQNYNVKTVTEGFGGIGRSSLIIDKIINPESLHVYEIRDDYAKQIASVFEGDPRVCIWNENSFEKMDKIHERDLVTLDCDNTFYSPINETLLKAFDKTNKIVTRADVCPSNFYINREKYRNKIGGTFKTKPEFLARLGQWTEEKTGYSCEYIVWHETCSYFVFVYHPENEERKKLIIEKVTDYKNVWEKVE